MQWSFIRLCRCVTGRLAVCTGKTCWQSFQQVGCICRQNAGHGDLKEFAAQGMMMMNDEIAYFTVRWKTRASFVYRLTGTVCCIRSVSSWILAVFVVMSAVLTPAPLPERGWRHVVFRLVHPCVRDCTLKVCKHDVLFAWDNFTKFTTLVHLRTEINGLDCEVKRSKVKLTTRKNRKNERHC